MGQNGIDKGDPSQYQKDKDKEYNNAYIHTDHHTLLTLIHELGDDDL